MADRFWVGNGGNTNDINHWSLTSGGAGGASVPTATESAKWDSLSFTLPGQTVTFNAAFDCLDFDWTGATNTPTMAGGSVINIYGSLTLISAMTITFTLGALCKSTTTGKTITTNGKTIPFPLYFAGAGGGWTLQDNYTSTASIQHQDGILNTNSKTVTVAQVTSSGTNTRTLTLGASTITCNGAVAVPWNLATITGLTFNPNTSTIILDTATTGFTFSGGGATYNNVTFLPNIITIAGSNTFNVLTLTKGKTVKITSGTTQTITSLVCNGTTALPSTLQSVTAASAATIALPAARHFIRHTSIKDITVSGATAVTSIGGTNVSGNTGITFVTKFEMGRIKNDGSLNWYSAATGTTAKVSG